MGQDRNKTEMKDFLELNENENMTYPRPMGHHKSSSESHTSNLTLHLKTLEQKVESHPKE